MHSSSNKRMRQPAFSGLPHIYVAIHKHLTHAYPLFIEGYGQCEISLSDASFLRSISSFPWLTRQWLVSILALYTEAKGEN